MSVTTEESTTVSPPADLPVDADAFWGKVPENFAAIAPGPSNEVPVIDQLGAAPFKKPDKGGFPFLGFLASVYEHVSTTARAELHLPAPTTLPQASEPENENPVPAEQGE